jgi:hypothetical protein
MHNTPQSHGLLSTGRTDNVDGTYPTNGIEDENGNHDRQSIAIDVSRLWKCLTLPKTSYESHDTTDRRGQDFCKVALQTHFVMEGCGDEQIARRVIMVDGNMASMSAFDNSSRVVKMAKGEEGEHRGASPIRKSCSPSEVTGLKDAVQTLNGMTEGACPTCIVFGDSFLVSPLNDAALTAALPGGAVGVRSRDLILLATGDIREAGATATIRIDKELGGIATLFRENGSILSAPIDSEDGEPLVKVIEKGCGAWGSTRRASGR